MHGAGFYKPRQQRKYPLAMYTCMLDGYFLLLLGLYLDRHVDSYIIWCACYKHADSCVHVMRHVYDVYDIDVCFFTSGDVSNDV